MLLQRRQENFHVSYTLLEGGGGYERYIPGCFDIAKPLYQLKMKIQVGRTPRGIQEIKRSINENTLPDFAG